MKHTTIRQLHLPEQMLRASQVGRQVPYQSTPIQKNMKHTTIRQLRLSEQMFCASQVGRQVPYQSTPISLRRRNFNTSDCKSLIKIPSFGGVSREKEKRMEEYGTCRAIFYLHRNLCSNLFYYKCMNLSNGAISIFQLTINVGRN